MKVAHLETGDKYAVWSMCNEDDTCPVIEVLKEVSAEHPDLVATITAMLFEEVPDKGPPLDDPLRAKALYYDLLYELKADKDVARRKHLGLRVAFFEDTFDDGPVIICAHAFLKSRGTPDRDVQVALAERSRY